MTRSSHTIPGRWADMAAREGQRTALQAKKAGSWETVSFSQLDRWSLTVAGFLLSLGLKKGDRAAINLENCPEWAVIYLGITRAGITAVPLDVHLPQKEFEHLIRESASGVLFCSPAILREKSTGQFNEQLKAIVVTEDNTPSRPPDSAPPVISFSRILDSSASAPALPPVEPDDIASLIFTSGTTEKPKGVLLSHRNICSNFLSIEELKLISQQDNFLSLLPLHHTYPFMVTLIVPLFLGAKITFSPPGFRPQDLTSVIRETRVTIFQGVPQIFHLIHSSLAHKVEAIPPFLRWAFLPVIRVQIRREFGKDLRMVVSGGARIQPRVARDLTRWGLRFTEGYGLTETSPVVTLNPVRRIKFGSVGQPLPNVKVKIDHPDENGIGEILIKGPNVMVGYDRNPALTASVIADGWFRSGDLGYLDREGYLFITGRKKEVIVLTSGKNIIPEELEEKYQASAYIKELCILPKREKRFGQEVETLFAVIVPDLDQCRRTQEGNIQGKIRWEIENTAKNLPPYEHIMGFVLTKEELPRTALRKLKRYEIRDRFLRPEADQQRAHDVPPMEQDLADLDPQIAKKVVGYLSQQLNRPIPLDSHLEIDLGIDSLTRVEMGLGLEKLMSISFPDEDLAMISTVRDLIGKISQLRRTSTLPSSPGSPPDENPWQTLLKEPPAAEVSQKIQTQVTPWMWFCTILSDIFFSLVFRVFWLLRVRAQSPLPAQGPFLLCPNHGSYLDGLVVFCSLPLKLKIKTYFLGYSLIFEHPSIRWSMKIARLVSIDASVHLTEAMQAASFLLSQEKIVGIFPEAERSIDGQIKTFRKGVGILVKELDVPVVPVYIKNSHRSWPRGNRLPRLCPLQVTFGTPLKKADLLKNRPSSSTDDYDAIAQNLREAVIALSRS